ncbi:LamG domain-containing protein [Actinoplanes sp. CA-142083]|uniref:LamG domain-containing protein n=1 Tax=Actinoplanes sp. CA-142083 TaxID=3239903 RepID=UPI003D943EF7
MKTGTRVEVISQRTEYAQMFAEPNGRFIYESAVTPQRVHRPDGTWADVDLTLTAEGDTIRPRASVADVRFSAGGTGPVATLVRNGKTLALSWPLGSLPEPTLAADSATYPNVLPDVDLVVRATRDGFNHVLAVKTPAAAADPRIREVTFDLGGTARVRRGADGSLAALAGGTVIASAAAPKMWDSAAASVAVAARSVDGGSAAGSSADPSTAAAPADTARTAQVGTALTPAGDLILKPDPVLLANATFPLYIDPAWSTGKTRWAYSTNNNSNNTDTSRARVGKDPNSGVLYRSYFEFPTSGVKSKYVYDAYVQMKVDHTWSCGNTPNTIFSTNPIAGTPRTPWKATSWGLRMLAQVSSHANEGTGCSDSPQPDMTINFNTDAVKSVVQSAGTAGSASITFVIAAVDSAVTGETTQDRWKKYFPDDARLITEVDAYPGKPTEQYVNGVRCSTSAIRIGTTAVKFSARMPDTDTTQAIKATWEWQKLAGSTWTAMTTPATSSAAANNLAASASLSGAANGITYRFHVYGTDPAPYNRSGTASDWCQFTIDTADPPVSGVVVTQPPGPGKPGQFKIRSEATDVTKFRYGWNAAVTEITPIGTETVSGVTYKYALVTLTPPKYGLNTLFLQAVDSTANVGDGSITFTVDRASPAIARWGLETYPGITTTDALADRQPSLAGDTPLTANGSLGWNDKGRLIGGAEATFTGATSLVTSAPVVTTTQSYGVAAWVRLDSTSGVQAIASQDGEHMAGFELQFRDDDKDGNGTADKSWCMTIHTEDVDDAHPTVSACAVNAAVAGRWTHVAGTVDATEKKMRIWVDGVMKQEVTAPTLWPASHGFRIGSRKWTSTANVQFLNGAVADVQAFDRVLVREDFTGDDTDPADAVEGERGMLNPIEVARYSFDDASACYDPSITDEGNCAEPDNDTRFGSRLHLSQGADVEAGATGSFGYFDNQQLPWVEEGDPFYGMTTLEYGLSQRNAGDFSTPNWQDAAVLRTDQSFTASARVHIDRVGHTSTAFAPKGTYVSPFYFGTRYRTIGSETATRFELLTYGSDSITDSSQQAATLSGPLAEDDAGVWWQLTLVYDAGAKTMKAYLNGELKGTLANITEWHTPGPMIIGGSWWTDTASTRYFDPWYGGIDDVRLFQGAMTDAQVADLNTATEA